MKMVVMILKANFLNSVRNSEGVLMLDNSSSTLTEASSMRSTYMDNASWPVMGEVVKRRRRLCSSFEMPWNDLFPKREVVEAGYPSFSCSSSVRILRHVSGVQTMMLGLPNKNVLYIPVLPYLKTRS
ncbi:hypothetical protein V8G54_015820 [Vigna mungo]|uniref:Uncharacterized protein n=1 Tax=Vigna mungo TaxID=3915 RepID=A0AAQ3NLT7_VIGMU